MVRMLAVAALCLALLVCALVFMALGDGSGTALTIVLLAFMGSLAACVAGVGAIGARAHIETLETHAVSRLTLTMVSDITSGRYGLRARARAYLDGADVGEVWVTGESLPSRGEAFACVGRFRPLADNDYGRSSWRQGIGGTVSVYSIERTYRSHGPVQGLLKLREKLLASLDPSADVGAALIAGCVCGSREALDEQGLTDVFAVCGIAHLMAVSGSHLSLLAMALSKLLERVRLHVRVKTILLAMLTGIYVLFCGAPVSALRAWLMSLVAFGAQLAGRRSHALSAVSVVALGMVLLKPTLVAQTGFQLSVLSVIGLSVFSSHAGYFMRQLVPTPQVPYWWDGRIKRVIVRAFDAMRTTFAVTLVCQIMTLPVTSAAFGRISLIAPLANLLTTPLLGFVLVFGALVCSLSWIPRFSNLFLSLSNMLIGPLVHVLEHLAKLPYASVSTSGLAGWIGWLVLVSAVVWALWWPRVDRRIACRVLVIPVLTVLFVLVRWRYGAPARIVVLDVGQGDAILIQDGAHALLVDTGPDSSLVEALQRTHVLHLDAVVLTHLHDDHTGGLDDLVGMLPCEHVIVAQGVAAGMDNELSKACLDLTNSNPLELSCGDALHVGGFILRMIWPHMAVSGTENADSIMLTASYNVQNSTLVALLTGDAEQDELEQCLGAGDVGDIDLLKVGHHGSEVSLTAEQARELTPELAVASAGEGNSYGHPSEECIKVLKDAGSLFLCTKDVGDVEVRPGGGSLIVKCR